MTDAEINRGPRAVAPSVKEPPSALVLSGSRRTRRQLFDLLDRAGCRVALSANGIDQARRCLENDPGIRLLVVDATGADSAIDDFCRELRSGRRFPAISVIGITLKGGDAAARTGDVAPESFDELLPMGVEASELAERLPALLEHSVGPAAGTLGVGHSTEAAGAILEVLPDAACLLEPGTMQILSVNPTFSHLTGLEEAQAAGTRFFHLDHGHDPEQVAELESALRRDGALKFRLSLTEGIAATGVVDATLKLVVLDDEPRYLATLRDPGPARRIEQCLGLVCDSFSAYLDDERLQKLLQQHAGWLGLDFLFLAQRSEQEGELEVRALHADQPMRDTIYGLAGSDVLARVERGEELLLQSLAWRRLRGNDPLVAKHRVEAFVGLPLLDANREVIGVLAAGAGEGRMPHWNQAVTTLRILAGRVGLDMALRRYQSDTRTQGLYDPLTRLPNRLLFEDRLRSALGEARRTGEQFAVLFVDLDRFRTLNDNFGHDIGDQVLRDVARRLGASVRTSDTVSRYASDCFLMILRHVIQKEDVARIVRKLCEALGRRLDLAPGSDIELTASIGASFYPHDATTAEELVRHAEQAMQSAKNLGRNTYQTYVGEASESRQQKLVLESKLQHAEQNNELRVYYQPQVSAESEDIVGMEALMRWQHPDLGLVSPGAFIPLAEETGLIVPMGEWLLREACRQAREWRDRFGLTLRLGVNLSALQLKQPGIVQVVASVLSETGLDPKQLELEVTESISIKDVRNLLDILNEFRQLGCSISIDDFGTGQSSLDYIRRFPADRIKIDQVFVRNIGVDPDDAAIVEATITMAHNLNRSVVAEGVEEEPQMEFLRRHGCEELQGFLFSRPLPAPAFERLLKERQRLMAAQQRASG